MLKKISEKELYYFKNGNKLLKRQLYYFKNGKKIIITQDKMPCFITCCILSRIWGDASGLIGDVSNLRGDASGIWGDVSKARKEYFATLKIKDDNRILDISLLV